MKLAIFSDVHGNLTALETVLADIKKQAPDALAFAGDLCFFGARPAACIERIKGEVSILAYGNTDEALYDPPQIPEDISADSRAAWEQFIRTLDWTREKLSQEQLTWLSRMPFSHRLSPTADAKDDLLIVHANPKDVTTPIPVSEAEQEAELGRVLIPYDEGAIRPLFEGVTAGVIAYGHVHYPGIQTISDITLANISSVSMPLKKDGKARYAILTWTKETGWEIEHRIVAYNFEKEKELLSFLTPPGWERMAAGLG